MGDCVEIKQLQVFAAVSEAGNLSKAALTLAVTQPMITRHIRALEDELGVELFYRNGRGVVMTEAGQLLKSHADEILDRVSHAKSDVGSFLASPRGKLVLGVPFYGHAWAGVKPVGNGLYQPGTAPKRAIDASYGVLARRYVGKQGYTRFWDEQAQAPYLWNAKQRVFVSYDDPESLRSKCRYLRRRGLAGVMFWQYYSDETGELLETLSQELRTSGAR